MKYSAIEQMYNGKRGQGQQIPLSEKYQVVNSVYSELVNKLRSELKAYPERLALYDRTHEAYLEVQIELLKCEYAAGFRFGLLIGVDAFSGE